MQNFEKLRLPKMKPSNSPLFSWDETHILEVGKDFRLWDASRPKNFRARVTQFHPASRKLVHAPHKPATASRKHILNLQR